MHLRQQVNGCVCCPPLVYGLLRVWCCVVVLACTDFSIGTAQPAWTSPSTSTRIQFQGRDFFPIGIYDYPRNGQPCSGPLPCNPTSNDIDHVATINISFNTFHLYDHDCAWPAGCAESVTLQALDVAYAAGLAVVDGLYSYGCSGAQTNWLADSSQFQTGSDLYEQIQKVGGHPALFMWEIFDENGCAYWNDKVPPGWPTLDQHRAAYQFLKTYGSGRSVWYNEGPACCQLTVMPNWFSQEWQQGSSDVYSMDIYANPVTPAGDDLVKATVDTLRAVTEDMIPTMIVLSAFQDGWNYTDRAYMAYSSIVHGACGIMWWGAYQMNENSTTWIDVTRIGKQLLSMHAALAARQIMALARTDTQTNEWQIYGITFGTESKSNRSVEVIGFSDPSDGRNYLITVNVDAYMNVTTIIQELAVWSGTHLYAVVGLDDAELGNPIEYQPHEVRVFTDRPLGAVSDTAQLA